MTLPGPCTAHRTVLVLFALFMLATGTSAASDCPFDTEAVKAWEEARPVPVDAIPAEQWFEHNRDWIIAPNRCVAATVAAELDAARAMFEARFQTPTTRGAVLGLAHAHHAAALRAAGADWVLPWHFPDPSAVDPVRAALEAQIRTQVEDQLGRSGTPPDPAQVDALVARALAQVDEKRGGPSDASEPPGGKNVDAIRHEIAHLLFIRELWPSTPGTQQYGGDAPDWLDETAAVLAESKAMTADRRAAFREAAAAGDLIPLEDYLGMPHPSFGDGAFAAMVEEARAENEGTSVIMLNSDDYDLPIEDAALFYSQTRGWIDFLDQACSDPSLFLSLTQQMKSGATFVAWLSSYAASCDLEPRIDELEPQFLAWAKEQSSAG